MKSFLQITGVFFAILVFSTISAHAAEPSPRQTGGTAGAGRSAADMARKQSMVEHLGRVLEEMGLRPQGLPLGGLPVGLYNIEFEGQSYPKNLIALFSMDGKQVWIMGQIPLVDRKDSLSTIALLGILARGKLLYPGFIQYHHKTKSINLFLPIGKSMPTVKDIQDGLDDFDYKMYWVLRSQQMNLEIEEHRMRRDSADGEMPDAGLRTGR